VCRAYADSDSPFSAVDVDSVVDAFRDGFSREATSGELGWMALHKLLPAIRNFVPGCAYERELCEILGRMYRAADDVHLNASKLLEDFSSILSARSQPPSRGDRRTTLSKRAAAGALTALVAQAEQAARKNERSFDEAEEVISSWHERVSSAEHEAYVSAREVERVRGEYARVQSEMASLSRRNHALEERIALLDQRHAEALSSADSQARELRAQKASLEARVSELESSQSIASSELGAVERANTSLREQRAELIDEISELKRDHALQMKQQQALEQRLAVESSVAEVEMRARSEYESMRRELMSRLQAEQQSVGRVRAELNELRVEAERVASERAAERNEWKAAQAHHADIVRANAARLESQIASIQSQAALEAEKLRSQIADERQHSQALVTEAKHETARAKAETLQAA
ncbi:MAG: hypothetical protein SGPRY_003369, partial [Prymnesium sp.]